MPHVSLSVSRSGFTIGERRKSLTRILNRQRSITMVARKIASAKMYDHDRLMGGTDVPEESEETAIKPAERPMETSPDLIAKVPSLSLPPPLPSQLPTPPTPPSSPVEEAIQPEVKNKDSQDKQPLSTSGPCCSCILQTPGSVGDRKVDEIIEYVHQNLAEAGKALATLGENFEHDLKLMFVDILGRIHQWTGIVQNKLDVCKNEVNNLRKELLARTCEIDVKTREVADLKARITDYQNSKMANERIEEEENIREKQAERPLKTRLMAEDAQAISDKRTAIKDAQAVSDKKTAIKDAQAISDKRTAIKDAQVRVSKKRPKDRKDVEGVIEEVVEDEEDTEEVVEKGIEKVSRKRRYDEKERNDGEERDDDVSYPSIAVQTVVQEEERMKRESELESEVTRLRKENDKIVKERTEYENAIQRALLRGVSSLNVETLRVLRCPPISCCTPCAPCPTAASVPSEPIVPCPAKSAKKRPGSVATTVCSKILHDRNGRNGDQTYCTTRQSCVNPCCSVGRSRKSVDSNMIFLLRQGDAGKLYAPDEEETPICGSPITKRIEIPPLPRFRT